MSIKNKFNVECYNIIKNSRIKEIQLIDILLKILSQYKFVKAVKYHQKRVSFNKSKIKIVRELCDILLVLKINGEYRFSFIQNKNMVYNNVYKGLGAFKHDKGQHYLLTNFPTININGIKSDILKNHKYKTITTYSVFYKDYQNEFDFDLSAAIETNTSNYKTLATHNFTKFTKSANEVISYKHCSEIETDLCFGEKINFQSQSFNDLLSIIKTFDVDAEYLNQFFENNAINNYTVYRKETSNDYINLCVKNLLFIDIDRIEK